MKKLTIVISSRKDGGANAIASFIFKEYLNKKIGKNRFTTEKIGKDIYLCDLFNSDKITEIKVGNKDLNNLLKTYHASLLSFLDPIKDLAIGGFGLDHNQCYGDEDDKKSPTHLMWNDLPDELREKNKRPKRGTGGIQPASGYLKANEFLHILENEMLRRIDRNFVARFLYSKLNTDDNKLNIVVDALFPPEITLGTENGAKVIRLDKKNIKNENKNDHILDDFPYGEYTLYVDNNDKTFFETCKMIKPHLHNWFDEYSII